VQYTCLRQPRSTRAFCGPGVARSHANIRGRTTLARRTVDAVDAGEKKAEPELRLRGLLLRRGVDYGET